jgi:hypothetical protein
MWMQGAWAQRGLVPAWKGGVVHSSEPESQCVYRIRFLLGPVRVLLSLPVTAKYL